MFEMAVLGGSAVMLVVLVLTSLWLDERQRKRQTRKQNKQRPLVPDFTKVKR